MKTLRIVQTDPINWDMRKMVSISPISPKSHKYSGLIYEHFLLVRSATGRRR